MSNENDLTIEIDNQNEIKPIVIISGDAIGSLHLYSEYSDMKANALRFNQAITELQAQASRFNPLLEADDVGEVVSDDLWDQAKQDSVGDAKKTMDYVKWIEEHYPQQVKGYTRQMIIEAFIAGQEVQKQVKLMDDAGEEIYRHIDTPCERIEVK